MAVVQHFARQLTDEQEHALGSSSDRIEALRARLGTSPDDASCWLELAESLGELELPDEAAEAFAIAARLELQDGDFTAALAHLNRSLDLAPTRAASHYEIARTHHQLGRFAEAFDAYGRAYEHFSSTQRSERSKEVLERMIRLKPDDIELLLERARTLEKDGEFKDALHLFRQCADELERSGSTDEFLEVTEHMLELAPEQPALRGRVVDALLSEAEAFLNYGLEQQAVDAIKRALTHAPDSTEAHLRLVLFYERQNQPMAFLDAVEAMARSAKGGRAMAAKVLLRAHEWLGNEKLIHELAETLEVDLNNTTQEIPPSIQEKIRAELGDEETAPRDDAAHKFHQESTRDHGVILGGAGRAHNLLALLQTVERSTAPSQLLIEDGEGNSIAELHARDGRLDLGVRLDGEIFVDKPLTRVSTVLAKRLLEADKGNYLSPSNTTTGERSQLYRLTARSLVELAIRAESQHFCLRSRKLETPEHDRLSFSPFALTMRAAGYLHSDSSKDAARFYDEMSDSSDEAWLLVDPSDGSQLCMPLRSVSTAPLSIAELRSLGRLTYGLLGYNRKIAAASGSEDSIASSFAVGRGLWCAVSSGAQLALVRTEQHKMGTVLSKARSATTSGDDA